MDVFGTITSTIDLANKVVAYIQAVKGAKEDRRKLHLEVSALGDLLKTLHNRLDNTNANYNNDGTNTLVMAGISNALLRCYEDLGHTVKELERIALPTNAGKLSSFLEKMKDVTWPFHEEDIKTMLTRIERLKSLISLALQASLMEFVGETRNELKNVGLDVGRIEAAVSTLEAVQKAHMDETRSLQSNLCNLIIKSQDSADHGMAKIEDKIDMIGRNQNDHMIKGDRMQADLTVIRENQELRDLVKWLSPLDFGEKHHMLFEKRARDTGEWFLKHSKFLAWRRGDMGYKTLWCPGHPGVGKSVMASLVINELGKAIAENAALVFIYFEYKTKYTLSQLAEVILKQLVRQRITQTVLESLRKHKAGIRPTSDELFDMLKIEVGTYDRVLVVIDALDEADVEVWNRLLERLQALREISLVATSRDTGEIELGLPPYQRLDITFNESDMRKYIEGRLESSVGFKRLLPKKGVDVHEIVTGVMKKADGMFLLAQLHMNSLEAQLNARDLRRALDELPNTLDATYDEAMSRISNGHRMLAHRIISWLIHAARPMSICDLQYALAIEEEMMAPNNDNLYDGSSITSMCVGLVILREDAAPRGAGRNTDNKVVGFVHYTTQEYFLRNPKFADSPSFAITCLRCLAFDIFKTDGPPDEGQLWETPFAEYAMLFWGVHARAYCDDKTVKDLAMELLHDSRRVVAVGSLPCDAKHPSAIRLCTHFGLRDYLEYFLDHGCDINSRDSEGNTVVSYAALEGQEEIMRLLLAREDVDVNPRNNVEDTPTTTATWRGHSGIVKLLLAQDSVDINLRGDYGCAPLSIAARRGHEAIVRLLLARDDLDVNLCDNAGDTPIIVAARRGHDSIVELLLAQDGVDINSRGEDGRTPLSAAAHWGHETIARLLLARDDLDVNPRDDHGDTPTISAARRGHSGTLELLLARDGVDINSRGEDGRTPLSVAAYLGREVIVQLLLARDDLDINPCDNAGDTPIIDAARDGHRSIVELLLARDGVDINSRGEDGRTPLSAAARGGHEAIVQLLLARDDLDINPRDTLIVDATWGGHSGIVELLLARDGVDINSRGEGGRTPLSVAARRGYEAITQLLLARDDLDVNPRDNAEDTPIITAVENGHSGIVELLLARDGVDINSRGWQGCTPLSVAACRGREAIVRRLLARDDLDVNPRDDDENTPLIGAARNGHSDVVELLLARDGMDINPRGRCKFTPLSVAACLGHEAIVQLLLARDDLDVNPRDNYGDTPIIGAVRNGHRSIVEFLLARDGVDINSQGRDESTALSTAVHHRHEMIVRLLLANVNLDGTGWKDDDGNTYLSVAAYHNNEEVAKWSLAKANIDVNSKNSNGDAPLSLAARRGNDAIVKLLLDQDGINVNLVSSNGKTPLDYAIRKRRECATELLRAAGGHTGRELGVEPGEDVGGYGREDGDTTEDEDQAEVEDRKEDKKVGEDKDNEEGHGMNMGGDREDPGEDRKVEDDREEENDKDGGIGREGEGLGGIMDMLQFALFLCISLYFIYSS